MICGQPRYLFGHEDALYIYVCVRVFVRVRVRACVRACVRSIRAVLIYFETFIIKSVFLFIRYIPTFFYDVNWSLFTDGSLLVLLRRLNMADYKDRECFVVGLDLLSNWRIDSLLFTCKNTKDRKSNKHCLPSLGMAF